MKEQIDLSKLPKHIAIIMDGNGRWAHQNGMERYMGHQEGVVALRKVVEAAGNIGIKYLTVYTFSTENWNRPKEEVDSLMELMIRSIKKETPDLMKNDVKIQVIGDIARLPEKTRDSLMECIEETSHNKSLTLILALSYSSRWEITEAARKIAEEVTNGTLSIDDINEKIISEHLTTNHIPDPDLLIRTGGEHRISNYLLWQLAYTELYFTDVYWPDFGKDCLYEAIIHYQNKERRFGKTSEQVKNKSNN